jgi:hypothetical protein
LILFRFVRTVHALHSAFILDKFELSRINMMLCENIVGGHATTRMRLRDNPHGVRGYLRPCLVEHYFEVYTAAAILV